MSNSCYILYDGKDEKSKGRDYSPYGLNIPDIATTPKEIWDLGLEIAQVNQSLKPEKDKLIFCFLI